MEGKPATVRSAASAIYTRITGDVALELTGGLLISVDLAKAFDSVPNHELYRALVEANINTAVTHALMHVRVQTKCSILHSKSSCAISMSRGLRQGCPVAPILYASWTGGSVGRSMKHWVSLGVVSV